MKEQSAFLEVMGDSPRNRILQYFVECDNLDIAIADVIEEHKLNKATAYNEIKKIIKQEIIKQSRKVGNTQLYRLNKENRISRDLLKIMEICIDRVCEEYAEKEEIPIKTKSKKTKLKKH
ncbi:hypothetical protein HOC35_06705 [Candidatus Woesearchaeota archaeon]|jgi:predicted transcriptional regulator|nr:hypothetical protein [Candidatus Woesearchaeota archaeon]